jgi:hypothetical protein
MDNAAPEMKIRLDGSMLFRVFLAIFPFIAFSISVVTHRYTSLPYTVTGWVQTITLLCMLIGALLPQWSYPYTMILIYVLFILLLGGDTDMTLAENIFYKSVIFSPVILIFFLIWLLTRRKAPLRLWYLNFPSQWTLLSYLVYGFLPLAINGIFTDIRSIYGAPYLAVTTLFAALGACLYLILQNEKHRLWSLSVCLTLVWAFAALGSATYWHGRQASWSGEIVNGYQLAAEYAAFWVLMLLLMMLPPLLIWSWTGRKIREGLIS